MENNNKVYQQLIVDIAEKKKHYKCTPSDVDYVMVMEYLGQQSDRTQKLFKLHYIDKKDPVYIANEIGLSVSYTKHYLNRELDRMITLFNPLCKKYHEEVISRIKNNIGF